MQKWEYKTIIQSRKLAVGKIPDWEPNIELEQLGEDGWELISVFPLSDYIGYPGATTGIKWVFKRPKPNQDSH